MNEQPSVADRVIAIRDDLAVLVAALNEAHEFVMAHEIQPLLIALTQFEEEHNLTNWLWPPKADPDGGLL